MSLGSTHVSLAYHHLCRVLRSPYNADSCEFMLIGCLCALEDDKAIILRNYPEAARQVYDLAMAFFASPRSPRQLAQLRESLTCHCEDVHPLIPSQGFKYTTHRTMRERLRAYPFKVATWTPFDAFVDSLLGTLRTALAHATHRGHLSSYKAKRRKEEGHVHACSIQWVAKLDCWPERLSQLLPSGAEDSIRGLNSWLDSPTSDLEVPIMDLVNDILVTRQLVVRFVVTAHNFWARVMLFILARMKDQRGWLGAHLKKGPPAHIHLKTFEAIRVSAKLIQGVLVAADPMQCRCFVEGSPSSPGNARRFAEYSNAALLWVSRFEDAYQPLEDDIQKTALVATRETLTEFESYVYEHFEDARLPLEITKDRMTPPQVEDGALHNPVRAAFFGLVGLYRLRRCAAPDCTATFLGAGRTFPHCTGCGRMPYCSTTCQRAAWEHSLLPHKPICKTIRTVAENWQLKRSVGPDDLSPFLNTFYAAAMADQRTETVRAFKAIAEHIEALQKAKLSPPGMCPVIFECAQC